jgi:outer membrane receptor protein involved in Fe transport
MQMIFFIRLLRSRKEIFCGFFSLVKWFVLAMLYCQVISAQTTGKISGKITDLTNNEPLIGANIMIVGTNFGAASDFNGDYFIINIPPGIYKVRASMVGYESVLIENVTVSVNRTSVTNIGMKETVLQGQEVVITADKITNKKDQTSSVRNINSEQIKTLPVENIDAVVQMQAGVVAGHFRGGRMDEVSYMVDGMNVNEASGRGRAVTIEKEVVSEVEVITGTFNAEYGNAMSGIVNVVTKDGSNDFHGSASVNAANYYTSHKDIFHGLKDDDFFRTKDYQLYFEVPVIKDYVSLVLNGRYQDIKDQYNGIRRFEPDNYSDFTSPDPKDYYSVHTGDNSYVPMGTNKEYSIFGKLALKPAASIRSSITYSLNHSDAKSYNHWYKYNPDGRGTNHTRTDLVALQVNHTLSNQLFYELKFSYMKNFDGNYLYDNYLDSRYLHDQYAVSNGPGFSTGGQDKNYNKRTSEDYMAKFDMTYQANKNHIVKGGIVYTKHDIDQFWVLIRNKYAGAIDELAQTIDPQTGRIYFLKYEPTIITNSSVYSDIYKVHPVEFSAYLQDKMEFESMVINVGLRYDYFDPATSYPTQWRNPANQSVFTDHPEYMSQYKDASSNSQISPRLGISYQLGNSALLRFSYGHFFQMPPLYALYTDPQHIVATENYKTTMGNPLVKPQKTIQYEVGLWQQLTPEMSVEVAVFYRDIYDLLSTKLIQTYSQVWYGLFSNKDYGNARGLELKYEFYLGSIAIGLNYTLQYTRGNADDPTFTFSRAGDSKDPVNLLIPMSWDQRHTLNLSAGYNTEKYGATLTAYYNSGTPYTYEPMSESTLSRINLSPNNSSVPGQFTVDLSAFYTIWSAQNYKLKLNLLAYNILDALNAASVYSRTGQPYTDIVREADINGHRSNFNDYYDIIKNPSMYSAPRSVKLGLTFSF